MVNEYYIIQFLRGWKKPLCPIDRKAFHTIFNANKDLVGKETREIVYIKKNEAIKYLMERHQFNVIDRNRPRLQTDFDRPEVYNRDTEIRSVHNRPIR